MTRAQKWLCAFYLALAGAALVATWSQNLAYAPLGPLAGNLAFWKDTFATPASRSITLDIALFYIAAAVWMVREARRLRIRWVGLYIVFGILVAVSVTFPLFLIARERASGR